MINKLKNLIELEKEAYLELMVVARQEAYIYFDKNIRELPRKKEGSFDESTGEMSNNDADAFRHAYVSGVFTQEKGEMRANLAGIYNEMKGTNPINQQNMDLWNNSVGRKHGKKSKTREELADFIKKALENNELIIEPNDPREYKGLRHFDYDPEKPVKVIQESESGRNQYFLDCSTGDILDRETFVTAIESGNYPGYTVSTIDSIKTPMSKPDVVTSNNLG